ncbi:MAG: translocation/assembly module TamB domain-containing protein [Pseudomonadota bacterium]
MVWVKRISLGLLVLIVALAALTGLALVSLNTSAGRDWVRGQVEALEFENGLKIGVGSIDGSLFSAMTLGGLTLSDPQGVFASVPEVLVEWNPWAFASGDIDIDSVTIEAATLSRIPEFNETPPSDAPLLPDYTIDIGEFALERLVVEAPVTGTRRIAQISGKARIADLAADLTLSASSVATLADAASGDVVEIKMLAAPEDDRLDLDMEIAAPADGVIAALTGWQAPVNMSLEGEGTWAQWDGQLNADWSGEQLAALNLRARDGTFAAEGEAWLALVAPETIAGLVGGVTEVNARAQLNEGAALIKAGLTGDAFTFGGEGGVNFEDNQWDAFAAQLTTASAPNEISGALVSGVDARMTLNGDLAQPDVAYNLAAQRLSYASVGLEGFTTTGETLVSLDDMVLPISACVARITGLDQAAGGALRDVRLSGDILIDWPRIVSDNLRLRSPRIDAGVTLIADAQAGRYGGAIDGELGDYRLQSVGLFDVESEARLAFDTDAGVALKGTVQARSTQVTNESVANLLGGDMVASSDVAYGRDGVTRLSNIRLSSPLLQVSEGQGTYNARGELDIEASGVSSDYGPLGLQLAGTVARPVAIIDAPNPGLGVGLAKVTATVRGDNGLYQIDADGMSDFGPVTANLRADLSSSPVALDIERADVGGVGLRGRLLQSKAGPYIGNLVATGEGLTGNVELSGRGEIQIATIRARARNVSLPGAAGARIGRGIIDASVVLDDQPQITADVQLANARYFGTRIDTLRAEVDLSDGLGSAKLLTTGSDAVPFRIAANADLKPDMWRAAIKGRVRGIAFNSDTPARIIPASAEGPDAGVYQLLPTRLVFNQGSVRLSGRFGSEFALKTRIDALDLAIANRFAEGLGINGKASGSVDFALTGDNAQPEADARLTVKGFSRSTALTVSESIDVTFAGTLREGAAIGRTVLKQRGTIIGRLNTDISAIPQQPGTFTERFLHAPLDGGLRYTGPAETLFSLGGLADQSLTGVLGVAVDFSGQLAEPNLTGLIRTNNLTYENETYGTQLTAISARGRFEGDTIVIENFDAKAGEGDVSASGRVSLAADRGFPMDLAISLNRAALARSTALGATATGELSLVKRAGERALLSGTLSLPETRYTLAYPGASEVPELTGVRFKSSDGEPAAATMAARTEPEPGFEDVRLDLKLVANDELYVSGMGLQSEWSADLRVTGTSAAPRMVGEIELVRGTLGFAGRDFDIEEGLIRFTGAPAFNPQIAITATEAIREVTVSVGVSGSAFSPQFAFSSTPGLPQDEILARILFGSSIANLSALEAVQLAQSLNTLSGSGGGINPVGVLQSATGLDRLRVVGADDTTGRGTALAAGQYISDDIYVEVITDARGFTATQLEISLTPTLSVLSQAGGNGGTNVNLRYRKDY